MPNNNKKDFIPKDTDSKDAGIDNGNKPVNGKGKPGNKRAPGKHGKGGKGGKEKRSCRQDPFWYSKDEATIRQMGSIPWTEVVGSEFAPDHIDGSVPAALIYPVYHTVGNEWVEEAHSLTRAANKYYQYLTQGFTGGVDFEAPDLIMTAIAACSLNALFKEGMRAYGFANSFSGLNKYRPASILQALGFHPDMFNGKQGHTKADFVTDFNIRVEQFNELIALPTGMFLRDRWDFIASGLFSDNDQDEYNTVQAYVTEAFLEYDGTSSITGTSLKWYLPRNSSNAQAGNTLPSYNSSLQHVFTYDSYFKALDHLISKLTTDDCRDMFGALRRVYSDNQFYKIPELKIEFTESIIRNDIVSVQLHNAECWDYIFPDVSDVGISSSAFLDGNPVIYQTSNGEIRCTTYATLDHLSGDGELKRGNFYPEVKLLDSFAVEPTPGNTLDMIAHLNVAESNMSTTLEYPEDHHETIYAWPVSGRSELLRMPFLYTFTKNSASLVKWRLAVAVTDIAYIDERLFASVSHVNSLTFLRIFQPGSNVSSEMYWPKIDHIIGEIDKYTIINGNVLKANTARSTYYMVQMPKNSRSVTK